MHIVQLPLTGVLWVVSGYDFSLVFDVSRTAERTDDANDYHY